MTKTKTKTKAPVKVTECPYDGTRLEWTMTNRGVCPRCNNTIAEPTGKVKKLGVHY